MKPQTEPLPHHMLGVLRRGRVPISIALTGSFAVLILIAAGFIFGLSFFTGYYNTLGLLQDKTRLIIEAVAERTRQELEPARQQVEFLAGLVRDGHLDVDDDRQLDNTMRASLAAAEQIESVVFADTQLQGRLWFRGADANVVPLDRDWRDHPVLKYGVQKAHAGGLVVLGQDCLCAGSTGWQRRCVYQCAHARA